MTETPLALLEAAGGHPASEPVIVTAVLVTYESAEDLPACLEALSAQDVPGLEVVVVDNASADDSAGVAERAWPGARVLRQRENRGFAAGASIGADAARGEHLLFLNPDAALAPGALTALLAAARERPDAGLFAPKVLRPDGTIDTVGHLLAPSGLNAGRGAGRVDDGRFDRPAEVAFPSGAAMLVRRRVVEEAGCFEPSWFAYGDEADLGLRAGRLGWKSVSVPAAVAVHQGSEHTAAKAYLVERNRIWVLASHLPLARGALDSVARLACQAVAALAGRGAIGQVGRGPLVAALLRAWKDALVGLPSALARRRRLGGDIAGATARSRRHRLPLKRAAG